MLDAKEKLLDTREKLDKRLLIEVAQNLLVEEKSLIGDAYPMSRGWMPRLAGDVVKPIA